MLAEFYYFSGRYEMPVLNDFRMREARPCWNAPPLFQSLKVVVSKCAVELSLPQTALLETYVRTCRDTSHSYRVFLLILYQRGPFSGRA
jgi:hypothetical protein